MIVKESRDSRVGEDGVDDRFPVGMRVLAVDDDPACLMLLDALLRKCQYDVTTTNQAVKALKMLRENKKNFDLVISDVQMPDMDGFKLLELVGLEMDLPVIMLSAYSETKYVMKGIAHGACDYLVKPVRIEELKNIWQHVIRKKKFDYKDQNRSPNRERGGQESWEGGQGPTPADNSDQNGNYSRKRKDQNEDEEDEGEENGFENEDSSTQKKPRVVWSVDLHRKFVAAVNQLGLSKAFPKRILDLMNVEGLTRENVASHLQKYRLYLKRISTAASQQANMVAALGGKDPSYVHMTSLNELTDFHAFSGSGRFSNTAIPSYPHSGMLGRLNTPSGFTFQGGHGLPHGILPGHNQNSSNSNSTSSKFQPVVLPADQNENIFPRDSTSLEFDQLQQRKCLSQIGNFNQFDVDPTSFTVSNVIPDTRPGVTSSSNSVLSGPSNPLLKQGNPQQTLSRGGYANQSSLKVASLDREPFETGVCGSSNFPDHGRVNEDWPSAIELSTFQSNGLPLGEPSNTLIGSISSTGPHVTGNSINFTSRGAVSPSLEDSRGGMACEEGLLGNVVQSSSRLQRQKVDENRQDYRYNLGQTFSTFDSLVPASSVVGSSSQSVDQNGSFCNRKMNMPLTVQLNVSVPSSPRPSQVAKCAMHTKVRSIEHCLFEQTKSQNFSNENGCESFEDLMDALIKQHGGEKMATQGLKSQEQSEHVSVDGEFNIDAYSLG